MKTTLVLLAVALVACGDSSRREAASRPGTAVAAPPHEPGSTGGEIDSALDMSSVDADFRGIPLKDAVRRIARAAGLEEVAFPAEIEGGPGDALPVTLQAEDISARSALEIILFPRYLTCRVEKGVLRIDRAAADPEGFTRKLYDLRHLTSEGDAPRRPGSNPLDGEEILDRLREGMEGGAWDAGVEVEYREGGYLLVRAPIHVHGRIGDLLEELRLAVR